MRNLFILLILCIRANAQLHDAQWVLGPNASVLDFREDTIGLSTVSQNIPFYLTSACISDEQGNLLFTCYGSAVTDRYGMKLANGDILSPCDYTYLNQYGFGVQQSALFLPMSGNTRYYYLLHFSLDTSGQRPGTLHYNIIDKEGNMGLGEVIDKNHVFHKEIYRGGGMTACKHANGRDWWIVMGRANTNRFYTFLLTPEGIKDTLIQDIGPIYHGPFDNAYSCFSEDGIKYVTGVFGGMITVMDFNRCSGEFSNPIVISNISAPNAAPGSSGVAFSPNGRYVYASNRINLTQYDLWASNIQDSVEVYRTDSGDYAQMHFLELAPNGKLYCSTWNGGSYFLHVVNNPDGKGDSCNFVYGGQATLSGNSFNLPNMPNYRLGALVGSGCDTIETGVEHQALAYNQPRIQPNPVNKFMYVEMPTQSNYVFELVNEQGEVIEHRETRQVDIINTEDLPSGIYFLKVTDTRSTNTASSQIVVQH